MTGVEERERASLRVFALVALVSLAVFIPFEILYRPPQALRTLLGVYVLHGAVAVLLLVAIRAGQPTRRLARLVVLCVAANLHLYLYVSPQSPSLVTNALTCLLIASPMLFSWSAPLVAGLVAATCVTFTAVGLLAHAEVHGGGFGLALGELAIGGTVAVACAAALTRFRLTLQERHAELRALSSRLMAVQEEERRRLSRELHDGLGQSLTAVASYLWILDRQIPEELATLRRQTSEARRLLAQTLGEMRELSQLLCPPVLTLYGLAASLEQHVTAFEAAHGIAVEFSVHGLSDRLGTEVETAVYRITEEALANVARHARARHVRVRLGAEGDELWLEIADDGIGMPVATRRRASGGTGLVGIAERVQALGGTLRVSSAAGACLRVTVPRRVSDVTGSRPAGRDSIPGQPGIRPEWTMPVASVAG